MKFSKYLLMCAFLSLTMACNLDSEQQEEKEQEVVEKVDSTTIEEKDTNAGTKIQELNEGYDKAEVKPKAEESSPKLEEKEVRTDVFVIRKLGVELKEEGEFDLMGYAAQDITIVKPGESSNPNCGRLVQLKNYNPEKGIEAVVMIKWKVKGDKNEELRAYKLKPSQELVVGSTRTCTEEREKVSWKIVSAKYLD